MFAYEMLHRSAPTFGANDIIAIFAHTHFDKSLLRQRSCICLNIDMHDLNKYVTKTHCHHKPSIM